MMDKTPLEQELAYEKGRDMMDAKREEEEEREMEEEARYEAFKQIAIVLDRLNSDNTTRRDKLFTGIPFAMTVAADLLTSAQEILEAAGYEHIAKAIQEARQGEV